MIKIIPTPKEYSVSEKRVTIPITYRYNAYDDSILPFLDYGDRIHEVRFTKDHTSNVGVDIVLDETMEKDRHRIEVMEVTRENGETTGQVRVTAQSSEALSHAFASLLLMMESSEECVSLPVMNISDAPDGEWRGLMIDLGRKWHPVKYIIDAIDVCWLYKINRLLLHFSDFHSVTLPSRAYPELAIVGRTYSYNEIAYIREYAARRSVMLVPELDMPGHCRRFQNVYPEVFGTSGVMCIEEKTFAALETLIDELLEMFPDAPYIHLGGDEAEIAKWETCEGCVAYMKEHGLDGVYAAYAHYLKRVTDYVLSKGHTPILWEGFSKEYNREISKDVIVIEWESLYQLAPTLLEDGFKVINCSWTPLYIQTYRKYDFEWCEDDILDWDIYTWKHWNKKSPAAENPIVVPSDSAVMGGMLCAWGDGLTRKRSNERCCRDEFDRIEARLPALAERTWNVSGAVDKAHYHVKFEHTDAVLKKILRRE